MDSMDGMDRVDRKGREIGPLSPLRPCRPFLSISGPPVAFDTKFILPPHLQRKPVLVFWWILLWVVEIQ
jgi:hypothetical protein